MAFYRCATALAHRGCMLRLTVIDQINYVRKYLFVSALISSLHLERHLTTNASVHMHHATQGVEDAAILITSLEIIGPSVI